MTKKTETTTYCQVDESQLGMHTSAGWEFVQVLEVDVVAYGKEDTESSRDQYHENPSISKPFVVHEQRYLLKRASDDPAAMAEAALDLAVTLRHEAVCARDEANRAEAKALQEVEDLTERYESLMKRNESLHEVRIATQNKTRAMEKDLGKVRKHFGDKAFDEALQAGE